MAAGGVDSRTGDMKEELIFLKAFDTAEILQNPACASGASGAPEQ